MAELGGQVALVTGATRGIGRAIAAALGGAGAKLVGTATTEAGANAVTEYLAGAGIAGRGMLLNVTDGAAVEACIAAIEKEYGAVGILVNNAGITRDNLLLRMKDAEWDDVLDTDLKSVFRLSRAVLRGMMKARAGRIINITSVVGASGNAGQVNYSAAKAGIAGMTRSLAREIGSRAITVNCVAPGFIDTDMTRALVGRAARAASRGDSARTARPSGGCRRGGAVPRLAVGGLHHRRDAARQRRHVHELKRNSNPARRRGERAGGLIKSLASGRQSQNTLESREGVRMDNVEPRVKKIVAEQLGVNEAEIKNESSFVDDLGADSLDTVELVMALEEEFETRDPRRGSREDHDRPAGDRLHQGARPTELLAMRES